MNDFTATHEQIAQAQAERAHWQAMMQAAERRLHLDHYTDGDTLCGHRATADAQRAADEAAGGLVALACGAQPATACPHCDWPVAECHCEPKPVLRDPCSVCGEGEAVRHVPSDRTEDAVAGYCVACYARISEYVLGLQLAERGE